MIIEITTPEGVKVKLEDANVDEIIRVAGKIIHMEDPGIIITGDGSGIKLPEIINKLSVSSGTILNPFAKQPARTELEQNIINILSYGVKTYQGLYECFPFTEMKEDIEAALQEMCLKGWLNRRWDDINNYYTLTPLGEMLITKTELNIFKPSPENIEMRNKFNDMIEEIKKKYNQNIEEIIKKALKNEKHEVCVQIYEYIGIMETLVSLGIFGKPIDWDVDSNYRKYVITHDGIEKYNNYLQYRGGHA